MWITTCVHENVPFFFGFFGFIKQVMQNLYSDKMTNLGEKQVALGDIFPLMFGSICLEGSITGNQYKVPLTDYLTRMVPSMRSPDLSAGVTKTHWMVWWRWKGCKSYAKAFKHLGLILEWHHVRQCSRPYLILWLRSPGLHLSCTAMWLKNIFAYKNDDC